MDTTRKEEVNVTIMEALVLSTLGFIIVINDGRVQRITHEENEYGC